MKAAAWNPFRLKNFVLVALILGIVAGIWLGDLFKGFGLGPGQGPGLGPGQGGSDSPGNSSTKLISDSTDGTADIVGHHADEGPSDRTAPKPAGPLKVLIDDREYYIRRGDKNEPISLPELVRLIERAKPDAVGLKARIDRTATSRVTTEDNLFEALQAAGVPKSAVYMPEQAID